MASKKLTERQVATIQAPPGKRAEIFDSQVPGLILRVTDSGRKTWAVRYRTVDNRQPRLTLGTYPAISLAAARTKALVTVGLAQQGEDPAGQKRQAKAAARSAAVKTFDELCAAYLAACERGEWKPKGKVKRKRTLDDDRAVHRRYVTHSLGGLRLEDVTKSTVKGLLREMVGRGIGAQTNRTHAFIRQVFAFAISEELVSTNPAIGFSLFAPIKVRERVLTDAELGALWCALSAVDVQRGGGNGRCSRPMAIILQLAILLLQRKSEVAGMRISELDLDQSIWKISSDRMKNGRTHFVPLPERSVRLIREAMELGRDRATDIVFPGARDASAAIRGDSVTHAMSRITALLGITGATVHDLRRTGATMMASERLSIAPFVVSRVLSHTGDRGGGAAVTFQHYNLHDYMPEKRAAMEAWENLLLQVVGERPSQCKVVQLREATARR